MRLQDDDVVDHHGDQHHHHFQLIVDPQEHGARQQAQNAAVDEILWTHGEAAVIFDNWSFPTNDAAELVPHRSITALPSLFCPVAIPDTKSVRSILVQPSLSCGSITTVVSILTLPLL